MTFDETRNLLFEGDSLTSQEYPAIIGANLANPGDYITNVAGGGEKLLSVYEDKASMLDQAPVQIDARYSDQWTQNIVVMWGGSNDLFAYASNAELEAGLTAWCAGRKAAHPGMKIILCTYLPRYADYESKRQEMNQWIRNNYATIADGLADIGANSDIGQALDNEDLTYYIADQVHLNTAGYAIVAGIVWNAIQAL